MSLKIKKMLIVLAMMIALPFVCGSACDEESNTTTRKKITNDIAHTEVVNKVRKEVGNAGCDTLIKKMKRDACGGDQHCRIKACQK